MKKILLLIVLSSNFIFGQSPSKFEITDDGMTKFIVTEVPGKSAEEIYTKTIDWINKTYKNPKEVLKGEVINDYVRFEGIKNELSCWLFLGSKVCYDDKYSIEVSVKDNKYKFELIELQKYVGVSVDDPTGFRIDRLSTKAERYDRKGNIKPKLQFEKEIPAYFNSLNEDLKNYILNGTKTDAKGDW